MQTIAGGNISSLEKMTTIQEGMSDSWISASDSVSDSWISILDSVINCFLIHVAAIVGVVGNAITLIILSRSVSKDSTSIILLSMAVCDLVFLVNLSVRKCDCVVARFDPELADLYHVYVVAYVRRPGRWAEFAALSHTFLISFERFISVFFPLQVSHWVTRRRTVAFLVSIYIAWTIYIIPYAAFNYEIEWSYNNILNRTLPSLQETSWFIENRFVLETISRTGVTTVGLLFSGVTAANSCAIAYRLSRVSKHRTKMVSKKMEGGRADEKATRMLLVVCVVFNACNSPGCVIYICFYVDPSPTPSGELHGLLADLEELLMAVNAAANFFVYMLMSTRFCRSVLDLLGCRRLHCRDQHLSES